MEYWHRRRHSPEDCSAWRNRDLRILGSSFRSVRFPATSLDALEADADVKFVSVDRQIKKKTASIAITAATINAPAAWASGYNGKGIGVAVLDSGINDDSDLGAYSNKVAYSEDFTVSMAPVNGKVPSKPASYGVDWYGHGQHIAGIIASNGKTSNAQIARKQWRAWRRA